MSKFGKPIFKTGGGPGGKQGKGTKPKGSWGSNKSAPVKKPGVTHNGGTSKQASQWTSGYKGGHEDMTGQGGTGRKHSYGKVSGQGTHPYGTRPRPTSGKPHGPYGGHGAGQRADHPRNHSKGRGGGAAVPSGQTNPHRNTIPDGRVANPGRGVLPKYPRR